MGVLSAFRNNSRAQNRVAHIKCDGYRLQPFRWEICTSTHATFWYHISVQCQSGLLAFNLSLWKVTLSPSQYGFDNHTYCIWRNCDSQSFAILFPSCIGLLYYTKGWLDHSFLFPGVEKGFTLDVIIRGQLTTIFLCIWPFLAWWRANKQKARWS